MVLAAAYWEDLPIIDVAALDLILGQLAPALQSLDAVLAHTGNHQQLVPIIGSRMDHIQTQGLGTTEMGLSALVVGLGPASRVVEEMGVLIMRGRRPLKARQLEHRQAC